VRPTRPHGQVAAVGLRHARSGLPPRRAAARWDGARRVNISPPCRHATDPSGLAGFSGTGAHPRPGVLHLPFPAFEDTPARTHATRRHRRRASSTGAPVGRECGQRADRGTPGAKRVLCAPTFTGARVPLVPSGTSAARVNTVVVPASCPHRACYHCPWPLTRHRVSRGGGAQDLLTGLPRSSRLIDPNQTRLVPLWKLLQAVAVHRAGTRGGPPRRPLGKPAPLSLDIRLPPRAVAREARR
jgi:hypothetical protein